MTELCEASQSAQTQDRVDLAAKARWVWRETLAINQRARETRIASSLSPIEIFVSLFYGGVLNFFPQEPLHDDRDRFIISKGHGSISMYPILADLGYFSREELYRVCEAGSFLGGIPDPVIPGYETVNGSLGHGLGVAAGMAIGLQRRQKSQQVFVLTGDGELHEGANWEAIMFASQHRLDNLNLIVDDNGTSMLGYTDDIISHQSLVGRLEAFGWCAREVDGHDVEAVNQALHDFKAMQAGLPKVLVCKTVKGRGVPGLERQPLAHILNPANEVIQELLSTAAEGEQGGVDRD